LARQDIPPVDLPQGKAPWTVSARLPGELVYGEVATYIAAQQKAFAFLPPQNVLRLFRAYGTDMQHILKGAARASDLGQSFGPISEREIQYLRENEWAQSSDDILWRRSKLGLHMKPAEILALRRYMGEDIESKKS